MNQLAEQPKVKWTKIYFLFFAYRPPRMDPVVFGLCRFHLPLFALQAAASFITTSFCRPSVIRRVPRRENDSPLESKTITVAVSQAAPPSSRLRLSESQLFSEARLPACLPTIPPAASPSLLSHGDVGPAIAVGQLCRCLRCARRASSLEGSGDRLISPGAHSPGKEGNIKKKR